MTGFGVARYPVHSRSLPISSHLPRHRLHAKMSDPEKTRLGIRKPMLHRRSMATLPSPSSFADPAPISAPQPGRTLVAIFIGYLFAFLAAHKIASPWGGIQYFSLWYPAAGVRLALLWYCGARWTPAVIAVELAAQWLGGAILFGSPHFWSQIGGVARAPLSYGLIIGAAQWLRRQKPSDLTTDPMPFGLAAVLAPTLSAFVAAGWECFDASVPIQLPTARFATIFAAFLVGDLLGVLLVSPALLWIAARLERPSPSFHLQLRFPSRVLEPLAVIMAAGVMAAILGAVSAFLSLMPILVSATWMGLRGGRSGAWIAIVIAAAVMLPWSLAISSAEMRIALHSGLAAVAISAYLAGSFSEGQRRARADVARRDRILFQAERLKTLRAMSVAVIHEISQPLSTLAIESRHLAAISEDPAAHATDIRESARLIERKAETLSNMVRRLRRFGGRAVDEPSLLSLSRVLDETVHLAAGEARASRSSLRLNVPEEELLIMGQEVELTQALLNLVRNAIAASPGRAIDISLELSNSEAVIHISNSVNHNSKGYGGMGIGSLVARAIIEAHGGRLERTASVADLITHEVTLPLVEVLHG